MRILERAQIEAAVAPVAAIAAMERGFASYSRGDVIMPPVGHIAFDDPPGDVHIKYGYRRGDPVFVIKIASGFHRNPERGLPSGSGLMLVLDARTGVPQALLRDEGWLTDLRTAAAGAVAAKYLAPRNVHGIGIVGAGLQARVQLDLLRHVTTCRRACIWARNAEKARAYVVDGFEIEVVDSIDALARQCNLIVTTTPARAPLLYSSMVRPGTHVTAVGADAPGKQELDTALLARADILAVDSRSQCIDHGDTAAAFRENRNIADRLIELGKIVADPARGRADDRQITVADLTGLAIQDIEIAALACGAGRIR